MALVFLVIAVAPLNMELAKFYAEMAQRMSGRAAEQMEAEDLEEPADASQAPLPDA